ncbi:DUF4386 domain-containing protein [Bizionia sp.]|uniref:DUF4386 domain-containing protein n=1 Tax=Bizionia sp. TaxID=1954480 RepID=UPI003A95B2FC
MKQLAKISGVSYLLIFLAGFYANFAVLESLIDSNSTANTTTNFINNHSQLGRGLFGFVVMLLFDVLLIWSLFGITKAVSKKLSYVASFFRLLHALFFCAALFKLWEGYQITADAVISSDLQVRVSELLLGFDTLWTIGLLFFGIHLIVLGYLTVKSIAIPKAIGILLVFSAIGYVIDGLAKLYLPNYMEHKDVFEMIVILPSVLGEFSFTIWLLIKGFNKQTQTSDKHLTKV